MPATNELLQEGRYRIGQRATGDENVFEAYDTVRNTNVVVREIPVKLNKVATVSQRESLKLAFTNQAKALAEIDHESLPQVHDYFSEIDRQFLVMEPVEGESLAETLARNGRPFSVAKVTDWANQLLDALHCLHTHKPSIIHRNVCPENISLHPSGRITLLGIGVENGGDSADDGSNLRYSPIEQIWQGLDVASQKAITNSYDDRSERILKEPLDARSDIYSLGATLYFLITGCEPVDPLERSIDILEGKLDPLPEPTKVDSSIPAEVSDVLMKALEIKRENRYDSAFIMREVLRGVLDRMADRDGEDAREQHEAAEIMGRSAEAKNAQTGATEEEKLRIEEQKEQQLRAAEEEKRRLAEAEQQKLREAEEQRRRDEEEQLRLREQEEQRRKQADAEAEKARREAEAELQRKAEEDRKLAEEQAEADRLREKEEAAALAAAFAEPDDEPRVEDNVLEIPVSAEVMAYREPANDVDEADLAAVLEELEAAEERMAHKSDAPSNDDVQVFENPVDMAPEPAIHETDGDLADIISIPEEPTGFSLPIPAIAGAVGLLVVLVIGGWFVFSGSSQPEKPAVQAVQTVAPPAEPTPIADAIVSTQPEGESTLPAAETAAAEQPDASKPAQAAKPKKTDAPKAPEKKKAVTVDDLINDN